MIFTKRKNMEYNFVVNLGVPAHFVKKTDFAIRLEDRQPGFFCWSKYCKMALAVLNFRPLFGLA